MKVILAADLPTNPSLEQLRKQAKDFRDGVRIGNARCVADVHELHPRVADAAAAGWAAFSPADARLVVARFYGFASWRRLHEHLDVVARYSRSTRPRMGRDGHGLGRGSGGPWRARLGRRQPTPARLVQDSLRMAAEDNLTDRVRLPLRYCADLGIAVDAVDGDLPTGYDLAVVNGNTEIANLLAGAGARRTRPLEPTD
jgi:hypothetical protein